MTYTLICPRCNKSREFYEVRECDPKTKKHWVITRCQKCGYNSDIAEGSHETRITKTVYPPRDDGNTGKPKGGWAI